MQLFGPNSEESGKIAVLNYANRLIEIVVGNCLYFPSSTVYGEYSIFFLEPNII